MNLFELCYETWWGFVGKDPDAQGSGSEKRDLLGAGRNQSQNTGRGQNNRKRGDPKTESASKQNRVEAGKSGTR